MDDDIFECFLIGSIGSIGIVIFLGTRRTGSTMFFGCLHYVIVKRGIIHQAYRSSTFRSERLGVFFGHRRGRDKGGIGIGIGIHHLLGFLGTRSTGSTRFFVFGHRRGRDKGGIGIHNRHFLGFFGTRRANGYFFDGFHRRVDSIDSVGYVYVLHEGLGGGNCGSFLGLLDRSSGCDGGGGGGKDDGRVHDEWMIQLDIL